MIEVWTIKNILDWTTDYFKKFKIEWPHLEAEILLSCSLGLKRIELYTKFEQILLPNELAKYKSLIERRGKREPIAYITNNKAFMSLDFYVDPSVLIPRPETELLVETVIDLVKSHLVSRPPRARSASDESRGPLSIVDIGTGSGCIAVSLAKYLSNVKVVGIDSSSQAIKIARKNAETHKIAERCQFVEGNMFETLTDKFDIIVSNPPYIPTADIDKLEEEVRIWEPRHALDGGQDGLDYIRKLLAKAPNYLVPNGQLLVEIGFDQGEKAKKIAGETKNFNEIRIIKDLNKKIRILIVYF